MNSVAKRYFDLAYEFQISAITLYTQIVETPYLYNPITYLLRHTVELLLKGLIIAEEKKMHKIAVKDIKIKKRYLNKTHSVNELWSYYVSVMTVNLLPEERFFIEKKIRGLEKKDFSSTRYRYPYKANGKALPVEPLKISVGNISPDLTERVPYVGQSVNSVVVVEEGATLLVDLKELIELTELLFNLSERME